MKHLLSSLSLAAALITSAYADTLSINASVGGAAVGSPKLNFDLLNLGSATQVVDSTLTVSFSGTGAGVVQGGSGQYAPPVVSGSNGMGFGSPNQAAGPDATRYLSTGIGSVIFNFSAPVDYFGLLWGSVDNYNLLSFYNGNDLVGSVSGTQVWSAANGDQGVNGTFYVNIHDLDGTFNKVVATSSSYAFEIDNVAYKTKTQSVPDSGATIAMLGFACAALGLIRRKR